VIRRAALLLIVTLLATGPAPAERPADSVPADDLAVLTDGVAVIASPGTPGALALVAPEAFPVVLGGSGRRQHAPVAAAARHGKGRVVAFGHGGYLLASGHDTRTLMRNAVRWCATAPSDPLRIGTHGLDPGKFERLREERTWEVQAADLERLRELDVLVMGAGRPLEPRDVRRVHTWVRSGGGLIIAATGWGWQQLNPDRRLADDGPMNRIGAPLGIVWTNDTVRDTGDDAFVVEPIDARLFNAATLLAMLVEDGADDLDEAARRQAERTLVQAARATNPDEGPLRAPLRRLARGHRGAVIPSPDNPVGAEDVAARIALLVSLESSGRADPSRTKAHPAAAVFPGEVPAGSKRATRTIAVDLAVPRWHSTGLYAVAGQPVAVVRESGPPIKGLHVRIGCHTDDIGGKDAWKRVPSIATRVPIEGDETVAASAFGGLVYIEVPKKTGVPAEGPSRTATFTIRGAVAAPTWVHGTTTLEEWRRVERRHPAPWGELISDRVIVSVPSSVLRDLDDPGEVMEIWNRVLDSCAELAGMPTERRSPERMVPDVQISAGYMHSGYPIMTHLDVQERFVSASDLLDGQWGFYHELGHNHQSRDWTFAGTGEVTCNLFSLYVYDRVCGKGLDSDGLHKAIVPAARREHIAGYSGSNADFDAWKRKPFVALTMYVQLAEAFGWDAYRAVFAEYRDLPRSERPANDQEKRDQWMVRFSRHVQRNLAPFFDSWGVPITEAARAQVADLEPWMPEA
jgi:hypothetical protein